jgi:HK97 family phage prohead protease
MREKAIILGIPHRESWVEKMLTKHAQLENAEPFFDAPIEIKEVSADGTFTGYGAVFSNVDLGRDIIAPGAFAKTLAKKLASKIKLLWQHDPAHPIGIWESLTEDKRGLLVKGRLLINQGVPKADEAYALLKAGAIDGMSIGFEIPEGGSSFDDKKRVRTINEASLWEVSLVTFPMNPKASVTNVKSVVPFQDLPLADRGRAWDGAAAEGRARQWAGGGSDLADMDWGMYKKAFLWYDTENPEQVTSYKLGIADVVGGTLTAVPRGVFAAAGALLGARGGVDIPADAKMKAAGHLERYYGKMDMESPFKAIDMDEAIKSAVHARLSACIDVRDYEQTLREVGFSVKEAKAIASLVFKPQRDVGEDVQAAIKAACESLQSLNNH